MIWRQSIYPITEISYYKIERERVKTSPSSSL